MTSEAGGTGPSGAVQGWLGVPLAVCTGAVNTCSPAVRRLAAGPVVALHVGPAWFAHEASGTVNGVAVLNPDTRTTAEVPNGEAEGAAEAGAPRFAAGRVRSPRSSDPNAVAANNNHTPIANNTSRTAPPPRQARMSALYRAPPR